MPAKAGISNIACPIIEFGSVFKHDYNWSAGGYAQICLYGEKRKMLKIKEKVMTIAAFD